jgi:tRNA (cytidine/uridine-2'-O-)-methyltransferase
MRNPHARRAGLDYWSLVEWKRWTSMEELWAAYPSVKFPLQTDEWNDPARPKTAWFYSTKGKLLPWRAPVRSGDFLVFGPETRGLSDEMLEAAKDHVVAFPQIEGTRSLNVSNAVAAAVYVHLAMLKTKSLGKELDSQERGTI